MRRPFVKIHARTLAIAGYFLLEKIDAHEAEPAHVEKRAVVAWGYENDDEFSIPYPVTLAGVVVEDVIVLRPDGVVEDAMGPIFQSLEEYVAALNDSGI